MSALNIVCDERNELKKELQSARKLLSCVLAVEWGDGGYLPLIDVKLDIKSYFELYHASS